MPELLNTLLADSASALVRESFKGVDAPWWWERRIGGGVEICQELDPHRMGREISERTRCSVAEIQELLRRELGMEDEDSVVLTYEVSGEATVEEAARLLAERSSEPEGLAAPLYRRVEDAVRANLEAGGIPKIPDES